MLSRFQKRPPRVPVACKGFSRALTKVSRTVPRPGGTSVGGGAFGFGARTSLQGIPPRRLPDVRRGPQMSGGGARNLKF